MWGLGVSDQGLGSRVEVKLDKDFSRGVTSISRTMVEASLVTKSFERWFTIILFMPAAFGCSVEASELPHDFVTKVRLRGKKILSRGKFEGGSWVV